MAARVARKRKVKTRNVRGAKMRVVAARFSLRLIRVDSENPPSPSWTFSSTGDGSETSSASKRRRSGCHATAALTKHVAESVRPCGHQPP
ncbi:hypothetical protein X777_08479 [Ooceraea biroi]|uniref:Uncharacterized protein n=1 Tax=Ooceraea biroi TaxID=2015173 RepID=A0A026WYY3_OOCBI|nr:hypothetical protein X777_08479 [Ooceraea biroi]